jgi:hypothetical protein
MPETQSTVRSYRPSNGSEGEHFENQFCAQCSRDAAFRDNPDSNDGCPILAMAYAFDRSHQNYPREWVTDDVKGPRCTAFTTETSEPPQERCPHTIDMFAAAA